MKAPFDKHRLSETWSWHNIDQMSHVDPITALTRTPRKAMNNKILLAAAVIAAAHVGFADFKKPDEPQNVPELMKAAAGRRMGHHRNWIHKVETYELRLDVLQFVNLCRAYGLKAHDLVRRMEGAP